MVVGLVTDACPVDLTFLPIGEFIDVGGVDRAAEESEAEIPISLGGFGDQAGQTCASVSLVGERRALDGQQFGG